MNFILKINSEDLKILFQSLYVCDRHGKYSICFCGGEGHDPPGEPEGVQPGLVFNPETPEPT